MTPLLAFSLHLLRPSWLLTLLLAPLFLFLMLRVARGRPRPADWTALGVRFALLALVAFTLSVPRIELDASGRSVAYVLDVSESIPAGALERAQEFVGRSASLRGDEDDAAFLVFADGAAVEAPFARISARTRMETVPIDPRRIASVLGPGESDMAGALRLARASFPPGGARRIVLLTDGNETRGNALEAARELLADGVDLQLVPLRYERDREVVVEKLVAPAHATPDQPTPFRVVVSSTHGDVPARVRFLVDGREVAALDETLGEGRSIFELGHTFATAGFHRMEAIVEPRSGTDGNPANNRGLAATMVRGGARVLVATAVPESPLAKTLGEELGIDLDVTGPEGLPSDPGSYLPYDAVVLENVPAFVVTELQRKVLAQAVEQLGVGLVCVGGRDAYGPGGYDGTAFEKALPVSSEVKNKRVLPSGALVIVLHTCEFAGGNKAGRDISKAAIGALSARDYVGIVMYGAGDEWLIPLQPVRDKNALFALLEGANPGDMPDFHSSLELTWESLSTNRAAAKHVIIISDGDASAPSAGLVAKYANSKVTITTVSVFPHGNMGNSTLTQLSNATDGRHYDIDETNLQSLPQIFIKEAVTVRRSAWKEEPFRVALRGVHPAVRGFQDSDFPGLEGYTVTTLKDTAEAVITGPEGDPILAVWRYGLGEVAAFTSDATPLWAGRWLPWGGYARFWTQTTRSVLRALERPGVLVSAETERGEAHVVVDALQPDGSFLNGLEMRGTVLRPDGESETFEVTQTGPGRYQGDFPATAVGTYVANLVYREPGADEDEPLAQVSACVCVSYSGEHLAQRSNERFVAQIEAAGATVLDLDALDREFAEGTGAADPASLPWGGEAVRTAEPFELWPWLAGVAALLLLLDVAVRRLRLTWPKRGKKAAPKKPAATAATPTGAAQATGSARTAPPRSLDGPVPDERKPGADKHAPDAPRAKEPPPSGGLLGAKRRAQKRQSWEDQRPDA